MHTPRLLSVIFFIVGSLFTSCTQQPDNKTEDGRTVVTLWVQWGGFEREALEALVDEYNSSQKSIFIKTLGVSVIRSKLLLATANGQPPDLAFLDPSLIPPYADYNALTPLDNLFSEFGISEDDFLPDVWQACSYKGFTWTIPVVLSSTALHYNKTLFKKAGLDPEKPPRTIEELESMNDRLTQYRDDKSIERIGHMPQEPGWWISEWGLWFGGEAYKDEQVTLNDKAWNNAGRWLASYPERFGADELMKFKSGFGTFASPQNAFFTGKVAMIHQGIWMDNFVQNFAPADFEYGIAPFPASKESGVPFISMLDLDCLAIPKGAKHVIEAFDFIRFLTQRKNLETLALAHRKLTPLREVTRSFLDKHSHPHVQQFLTFARSPYLKPRPNVVQYQKFRSDMIQAFEGILADRTSVKDALDEVQSSQSQTLQNSQTRWNRVKDNRLKEWSGEE